MSFTPPNLNYLHAGIILKLLAAIGCRRVVISPGSRSTPLAHTAVELDYFDPYVIHDERSAAFFALGLSKADGVPAILICTSGTATANYYPAVIEAYQSLTPLVLLTADRPIHLRNSGAPQTIDQSSLYNTYSQTIELPLPRFAEAGVSYATHYEPLTVALERMRSQPLHVNVPFDEPLAPVTGDGGQAALLWKEQQQSPRSGNYRETRKHTGQVQFDATPPPVLQDTIHEASERIRQSQCGLVVAGPDSARTADERSAILELARLLGWPVFADVLSGARDCGDPVSPYYDVFLRKPELFHIAPDVVLAIGAFPTSRVVNEYLDTHKSAYTLRIQPHGKPWDPTARATRELTLTVRNFLEHIRPQFNVSRDSLLLEPFLRASGNVRSALNVVTTGAWTDCEAIYAVAAIQALPDSANLVLANSMPVRYADTFAAYDGCRLNVFGMRGANGIDGTVSHAAGIASASVRPTLLITGDLAFLHDLNGCAPASRFGKDLTILLVDNNGGGIFHFLPVKDHDPHFDTIHGTPHDLNLSAARDFFQLDWVDVNFPSEIPLCMAEPHKRPRVLYVRTNRDANHRAYLRLLELLLMKVFQ